MKWLILFLSTLILHASQIQELFDALVKQPHTKLDSKKEQFTLLKHQEIQDRFYPKVDLFATYEHYNSPTNLRPVPPTELAKLQNAPYPFAQTIERIGVSLSMPLFSKELFSLLQKSSILYKSTKVAKKLNLLERQATLLALDANWIYLNSLKSAIEARKRSLQKVYNDLKLKVNIGKAAPIALNKIEELLYQLDISLNSIDLKEVSIQSQITALTNKELKKPASLSQKRSLQEKAIFALKPLELQTKAKRYDIQASYDSLYPKLVLNAKWSENYSQRDLKLREDVHRGYGSIILTLKMPLFDKNRYTKIEEAKVSYQKSLYQLEKKQQELQAQIQALQKRLKLLKSSYKLAQRAYQNQKELLDYAKVAFEVGKIDEEEYLRYEQKLLESQSRVYETKAKYWQELGKLAVLYGIDLKEIVE